MNIQPEPFSNSETPVAPENLAPGDGTPPSGWRHWLRRLLVCNPFFLASAALLLLGVNRLSTDDRLFAAELPNLLFNFFSLQSYELLVIATALVLARRKVLYDSALLVALDHGLVLVPFMLISQATLEGLGTAGVLVLAGATLVTVRVAAVRKWYPRFNLPPRALALGAILLAANIALPLLARPIMERQVQDWAEYDPLVWLAVLPILAAGANLLPRPDRYGGSNPERHWLPLFVYGLWIVGSAVHAWCVSHICSVPFQLHQLAPVAWVCSWTMQHRLTDCIPSPSRQGRTALLAAAAVVPLMAAGKPAVYLTLACANLVILIVLWLRTPPDRFVRRVIAHLMLVSSALIIAGLPLEAGREIVPGISREQLLGVAGMFYLAIVTMISRRADIALIAAFALGLFVTALRPTAAHLGFQAAAALLIAHSLRWEDRRQPGATLLRWLAVSAWMLESIAAVRPATGVDPIASAAGAFVLTLWLAVWWRHGLRPAFLIPAGACTALAANPVTWCAYHSSVGIVALAASLALFAAGTGLAWNRRTDGKATDEPGPAPQ